MSFERVQDFSNQELENQFFGSPYPGCHYVTLMYFQLYKVTKGKFTRT